MSLYPKLIVPLQIDLAMLRTVPVRTLAQPSSEGWSGPGPGDGQDAVRKACAFGIGTALAAQHQYGQLVASSWSHGCPFAARRN